MNITEQEAREALKSIKEWGSSLWDDVTLLSALIDRYFKIEKALKEIHELSAPTDNPIYTGELWADSVHEITTKALTGKIIREANGWEPWEVSYEIIDPKVEAQLNKEFADMFYSKKYLLWRKE